MKLNEFKDCLGIFAGILLCSVGAYGFIQDLNLWGWWVFAGVCLISGIIFHEID